MIAYIFKSSLSLIILFGLYWFLLRKEKIFFFNRYFLVLSVVLSLIVPLISIPVNFQTLPQLEEIIPAYDYVIPEISTAENIVNQEINVSPPYAEKHASTIYFSGILLALYISGAAFFLLRFMRSIYLIIRRLKLSEKVSFEGYRIVLTNDKAGPYCFFSNIFLNSEDYLNGKIEKELLDHELEHARQSHTTDIILIELLKIFYWFNPVHLLYDRAIRINHEYLADNGVISNNCSIKSYSDKLLSFITGKSKMLLTSGSNHSFTKNRLLMMTKSRSKRIIYGLRISTVLSFILVFTLFLSFKQSDILQSNKGTDSNGLTELQTVKDIDKNVYKTVTIGNYVWMAENLKTTRYNDGTDIPLVTDNEQWQKYEPAYWWYNNGVMDQNTVRGIVMTKDGNPLFGATISSTATDNTSYETIADFDGHFILNDVKSGATLLFEYRGFKSQILKADFESEMFVKLIRDPDFDRRVFITEVQNVNFRNSDFTPAKALLSINGEIINYNGNLRVNPGEIKSFKVLKDKEATAKYGDKARDGAVEIILFEEKTGPAIRKQSDKAASDTSKYETLLRINHTANKGELIDIPVSNLQYVSVWINNDIDKTYRKEHRSIAFMTRDYFKVKGIVVQENGKPLPGVKISATDNSVIENSDKEGRFEIEDVREGALIEFSHPGYKTYYLSTLYEVAFNMEMTIELMKENIPE